MSAPRADRPLHPASPAFFPPLLHLFTPLPTVHPSLPLPRAHEPSQDHGSSVSHFSRPSLSGIKTPSPPFFSFCTRSLFLSPAPSQRERVAPFHVEQNMVKELYGACRLQRGRSNEGIADGGENDENENEKTPSTRLVLPCFLSYPVLQRAASTCLR